MKKTLVMLVALVSMILPVQAQTFGPVPTMGANDYRWCDNLTTLTTLMQPRPLQPFVWVMGQAAFLDGGGGLFAWDATNTLGTNYAVLATTALSNSSTGVAITGNWVWKRGTGGQKPPRTQALLATNQVIAEATVVRIVSVTGATTNTATPFISATATGVLTDGLYIEIIGTDDTLTVQVQDDGTLSGSKLQLAATTRTLGKGDVLKLRYNLADGFWYEEGFTNNL